MGAGPCCGKGEAQTQDDQQLLWVDQWFVILKKLINYFRSFTIGLSIFNHLLTLKASFCKYIKLYLTFKWLSLVWEGRFLVWAVTLFWAILSNISSICLPALNISLEAFCACRKVNCWNVASRISWLFQVLYLIFIGRRSGHQWQQAPFVQTDAATTMFHWKNKVLTKECTIWLLPNIEILIQAATFIQPQNILLIFFWLMHMALSNSRWTVMLFLDSSGIQIDTHPPTVQCFHDDRSINADTSYWDSFDFLDVTLGLLTSVQTL